MALIETLIEPNRRGTPAHRGDAWRVSFERSSLFGALEKHVFPNEQVLDETRLAARIASISFIAGCRRRSGPARPTRRPGS